MARITLWFVVNGIAYSIPGSDVKYTADIQALAGFVTTAPTSGLVEAVSGGRAPRAAVRVRGKASDGSRAGATYSCAPDYLGEMLGGMIGKTFSSQREGEAAKVYTIESVTPKIN